jgi:hypothetical protein
MKMDVTSVESSVLTEDGPVGSRAVVAFFAGLAARPYFEFHRTGGTLRAHRVYLRDLAGDWYQNGLPGAGGSADELAGFLRDHCARLGATRLVTAGNSAGGFAAVLFGILAGADEVHAFAPKIRIVGPSDFRDQRRLAHVDEILRGRHAYRDLPALLREGRGGRTAIHVHYPSGDAMDRTQAELLAGLPNVTLWKYPWEHHGIVRQLGKGGLVRKLIENAVTGEPRRVGAIARQGRWYLRLRALGAAFTRAPAVAKRESSDSD